MGQLRFIRRAGRRRFRAVGVQFGPWGAFLRANDIPDVGAEITLEQVGPGGKVVDLKVEATVTWAQQTPTLLSPEPGYRVTLRVARSHKNPGLIKALAHEAFGDAYEPTVEGDGPFEFAFPAASAPVAPADGPERVAGPSERTESASPLSQRRDAILVSWSDGEVIGRALDLSTTGMTIAVGANAPPHYEKVTLTPCYPSFADPHLLLHGALTQIEERGSDLRHLTVRLWQIEELGHTDVFSDYRVLITGQ